MGLYLWTAFFLVSNLIGVEVFKAAMTLPRDEAVFPAILAVPLIGMTAVGASRMLQAWNSRGR